MFENQRLVLISLSNHIFVQKSQKPKKIIFSIGSLIFYSIATNKEQANDGVGGGRVACGLIKKGGIMAMVHHYHRRRWVPFS